MSLKTDFRFYRALVVICCSFILIPAAAAEVIEDNGRTYLIDQTGERWDITQAVSIGFDPRRFEFGIGRNAFRPLDDSDWPPAIEDSPADLRVIGVADGEEAHAYAVSKLWRHETANTRLESKPIVVGY